MYGYAGYLRGVTCSSLYVDIKFGSGLEQIACFEGDGRVVEWPTCFRRRRRVSQFVWRCLATATMDQARNNMSLFWI